ncbi:MAG: hypothetical protein H6Q26_990 [Bacteroidetes bacterium]|uniref:hypothetical protein n=1 Tax=Chitinophaga sp. LS1 TaxID=3051176 RepID=UPI001DA4C78E|nr:hypothetical protein [Chitinophaga sp. LS1]MBP1650833.1 hypothetical protein [Bacteroidota bacterium]WPV67712.1 hypothetical protein QQL36_03100 [Chitinophaga sp. LS1]
MYDNRHHVILGFHGCDEETCQRLVNDPKEFHFNKNSYDWLGNGMYFWENDLERARQWALEKQKQGKIRKAAVLGAFIDPGNCCDFMNSKYTGQLADYYVKLNKILDDMPHNEDVKSDPHKDKLLRKLDCAVIEQMHKEISIIQEIEHRKLGFILTPGFDTVRCAFLEGAPAFPGAAIKLKNHIQICVRNPNSILAFFRPRLKPSSILAA